MTLNKHLVRDLINSKRSKQTINHLKYKPIHKQNNIYYIFVLMFYSKSVNNRMPFTLQSDASSHASTLHFQDTAVTDGPYTEGHSLSLVMLLFDKSYTILY